MRSANACSPSKPSWMALANRSKSRPRSSNDALRDGQIEKAARGKYANRGKIGKKDPAAEQPSEVAEDLSVSANLSNLSPKEEPGGTADERTTP